MVLYLVKHMDKFTFTHSYWKFTLKKTTFSFRIWLFAFPWQIVVTDILINLSKKYVLVRYMVFHVLGTILHICETTNNINNI